MGKGLTINLGETDEHSFEEDNSKLKQMAEGLPSANEAKKLSIKRAPRTQLAFSQVPVPIKKAFEQAAKDKNMTMKNFLYYCLRAGGVDIPDPLDIDARRL